MLPKLFFAFALIPIAEIYILLEAGKLIGSMNTILTIIVTAFVGAYLARIQGAQTMLRIRSNLQQGTMPADELVDALLIFVAGVVLLTPGFITDAAGLLLLFPASRGRIKTFLKKKFIRWIENGNIHIDRFS